MIRVSEAFTKQLKMFLKRNFKNIVLHACNNRNNNNIIELSFDQMLTD